MSDEIILNQDSGGNSGPREQHPTGTHIGVCVDIVSLGDRVKEYPGAQPYVQPQVAFVFQTGIKDAEGRLFSLTKEMGLSSGKKATLPKFIGTWRGEPLTPEEIKAGVKLSQFLGKPAQLSLVGKLAKNGNTYTNIDAVTPLMAQLLPHVPQLPTYERPEFWEQRKMEYADGVAEFKRKAAIQAQRPTVSTPAASVTPEASVANMLAAEQKMQDDTLPPF